MLESHYFIPNIVVPRKVIEEVLFDPDTKLAVTFGFVFAATDEGVDYWRKKFHKLFRELSEEDQLSLYNYYLRWYHE